ncbi:MAG: acetyl/propionyl/methylcrotonyl-CoA carboxylase subunit alpha [Betaproteobacteria bacterium]|nr:acetyl/propionyl/methylcrotonyl-CoA carboxylase subunit alpha [Betaproteobacteria bacterium]
MFGKILVANRGEIACRVIRTARRLGVRSVAVYSDADRHALHVRTADEARRIGPPAAAESYLNIAAILEAAKASGAEAIHPGYGFLSENEDFAAACGAAGIVFIGPSTQSIAAMGDKAAAKRLMEKTGVPLVPGYHGEEQDPVLLEREAAKIGFPVLIKPSAGGGGKGMRVVAQRSEFAAALEASQREARSSFGDERVLVERYLEQPRHIEVQVFGDGRGNAVHLFERDCSVQRRHQKVLEEAPAPGLDPLKRAEMGKAAVAAAKAIQYAGAGTVEFIAEQDGRFYFMEMNTRLQVEHPVTEMITGLDLVEWQLRVAAGEPLPLRQDELRFEGHAIEARVYAEDPDQGFLPSTGRLVHVAFPGKESAVRVDTGIESGAEVSPFYDPLLAKIIVCGGDRPEALARLKGALRETQIAGVTTNVAFLSRVVATEAFGRAALDTGLIERHRAELFPAARPVPDAMLALAALEELRAEEAAARQAALASGESNSPWHEVDGWRLNLQSHHDFVFAEREKRYTVRVRFAGGQRSVEVDGRPQAGEAPRGTAIRDGKHWHVFLDGEYRRLSLQAELGEAEEELQGSLAAPMPGKVAKLLVAPGAKVKKGDPLLILEAMKMEHTIVAPSDGIVKEIHFAAGEQVAEGAQLASIE